MSTWDKKTVESKPVDYGGSSDFDGEEVVPTGLVGQNRHRGHPQWKGALGPVRGGTQALLLDFRHRRHASLLSQENPSRETPVRAP